MTLRFVAALIGLAGALLALVAPAVAAPPRLAVRLVDHPGGGPGVVIAGVSLTCPTSAGGTVWWLVTRPGGPIGLYPSRGGVSWTPGPRPHVFLRADLFGGLPAAVQLFIALHECAHFHLAPSLNTELNADCWTVRTGLANGWLTEADLDLVRRKLAASRDVAGWGHPGSALHADNIPRCLSGR